MRAAAADRPNPFDHPLARAAASLFGVLALVNMWSYVAAEPHPRGFAADFNALWAAGKTWIDGHSPYLDYHSEALVAAGARHLHDRPPPYFYPPATIAVFGPLGFFGLGRASLIWSVVTFTSLVASSAFFAALATTKAGPRRLLLFLTHLAVAGLFWDAAEVIGAHNNGDFFFYAAFVATLLGARRGGGAFFAAALTLTLMRPQFGLVLWAAAMMLASLRPGAVAAALATAALSLAGLWNDGLPTALAAFLDNLSVYGSYPENAVRHTSGAGFLLWASTGLQTSPFLWAALAAAVSAFVAAKAQRAPHLALLAATCVALSLLPAHNTYYFALTPALILYAARGAEGALMIAGGLVLMKSWTIARAFSDGGAGYLQLNSAAIDSLGATLVACGVLLSLVAQRRRQAVAAPVAA